MKKIIALMTVFVIAVASTVFCFVASAYDLNDTPHTDDVWVNMVLSEHNDITDNYFVVLSCYHNPNTGEAERYLIAVVYTYTSDPDEVHINSDNDFDYGTTTWISKIHRYSKSNSYSRCDRETNNYPNSKAEGFSEGYRVLYSSVPIYGSDGSVIGGSSDKYKASVTGNGSTIEYSVEFLKEGEYSVTFGAYAQDNAVGEFPYSPVHDVDGTYYYNGKSVASGSGDDDSDLGIAGGKFLGGAVAGANGEKLSYKYVSQYLDLNDFYDKMQDKTAFKNAENIYYTITITDINDEETEYFSYVLPPGQIAETVQTEENGILSTKLDYVSFPPLSGYISVEFPDIRDYCNFDAFKNIEFEDVGGTDAVIDVLKNIWYVIKAIFEFIIQCVIGFFIWLFYALKFVFFGLIGLIQWLGACLWVIVQNIGIALYNLAVDIRRLLAYLFVPSSSNMSNILDTKFPSFNNLIAAAQQGKLTASPSMKLKFVGKEFTFSFNSVPDSVASVLYGGSTLCLRFIQLALIIKCLFLCFGVHIGSGDEGGESE